MPPKALFVFRAAEDNERISSKSMKASIDRLQDSVMANNLASLLRRGGNGRRPGLEMLELMVVR